MLVAVIGIEADLPEPPVVSRNIEMLQAFREAQTNAWTSNNENNRILPGFLLFSSNATQQNLLAVDMDLNQNTKPGGVEKGTHITRNRILNWINLKRKKIYSFASFIDAQNKDMEFYFTKEVLPQSIEQWKHPFSSR